ncbi:MAG: NAD(P)H-dependent glycerol-3-phosphate dehydrogenase [Dehalococcoidia bacterium]
MTRTGILGTTAWATTLGIVLARQGHDVVLWARSKSEAEALSLARQNARLVPGVRFPDTLTVSSSAEAAFGGAELVFVVVPSVTMRANLRRVADAIPADAAVVSGTKGIEIETGKRMSMLIAEELPQVAPSKIGALSGPNLAPEVAGGKVASATVAFPGEETGRLAQEALNSEVFRVYTSDDVTGVELGGALKNIIAIGAGIIDGMKLGDNAKAAFVTRGLHEITRLGVALGARPDTFAGLTGMGDLVATCYSGLSRNRRVGQELGAGRNLDEILRSLGQTAEGVPTTSAAINLAKKHRVEMPIAEATRRVLFEGLTPSQAIGQLMRRAPQPEVRL